MPKLYKILGQISPEVSGSPTVLYGVRLDSAVQTVVSTISICNISADDATYKIWIRPNGEARTTKHTLVFNATVPGNDSVFLTNGISLQSNEIIEVESSNTSLAFSVFGAEVS
jgi:hypothetical protein